MKLLGTVLTAAAGGGVLASALHTVPAVSALGPLRRTTMPKLSGMGDNSHVALTFDDGPDPASTPAFLEALDRLGWKATFFMLGSMAAAAPGLAREVAAAGHEIALHGGTHHYHIARSPRWVANDLARGYDQLGDITGQRCSWHRPPYGVLSGATLTTCRRLGLRAVLWDAWGRDWRHEATPSSVLSDLSAELRGGSTLLLHDSDCTSAPGSWRSALGALEPLAAHLELLGLRVGPLRDHAG